MSMVAFIGAAKEMKVLRVKPNPPMSCSNCENKIKKTIRFEKGVKQITTDLKGQVVTVEYDADKTTTDNIIKAFEKLKYKVSVLKDETNESKGDE